jgi:hypothetical protein
MPIALLLNALQRIRIQALSGEAYSDPWTCVSGPGWPSNTIPTNHFLIPDEHVYSQQCTSYQGTIETYRAVRNARAVYEVSIEFDFIRLAPRLADFKLIFVFRQLFVQYKLDGRIDRPHNLRLEQGGIGPVFDATRHWYFTPFEQ